jgi:hypothetical protein
MEPCGYTGVKHILYPHGRVQFPNLIFPNSGAGVSSMKFLPFVELLPPEFAVPDPACELVAKDIALIGECRESVKVIPKGSKYRVLSGERLYFALKYIYDRNPDHQALKSIPVLVVDGSTKEVQEYPVKKEHRDSSSIVTLQLWKSADKIRLLVVRITHEKGSKPQSADITSDFNWDQWNTYTGCLFQLYGISVAKLALELIDGEFFE